MFDNNQQNNENQKLKKDISIFFMGLVYFIGTAYTYVSTADVFQNHILSIIMFSFFLGFPFFYCKNLCFGYENYILELNKKQNDCKILALVSSVLIALSGIYNYIIFQQQNYDELIKLLLLSVVCYFVYSFIFTYVDKFYTPPLEKQQKNEIIFEQIMQTKNVPPELKRLSRIVLSIVLFLGFLTIFFKYFSNIPSEITDFWDYYKIFIFICFLILVKFTRKMLG